LGSKNLDQQIRRRYNKEYWVEGEKSLQEHSLQAYSTEQYRSIDSVELIFKIETQENLYHKVTIGDSRGIPIRYSTLKPYSRQEIQLFVKTAYQDWYKAGGYFYHKFYRGRGGYPGFGRGGGTQPTRDQVPPTRRRRSLSPTQFRFLYQATPLAVPGTHSTQQSNQQQTPQRSTVPQTTNQSPAATIQSLATTIQSPATTSTVQHQGSTPTTSTPQVTQQIDPTQLSTAMLYQSKLLTPQQQALLSQLPHTQRSLIGPTQHAAIANSAAP